MQLLSQVSLANTGITASQATAITANTAKVSVAGLNQVGAAVLSTDSVVYYAGTALAPRRKTFSLVPLSIMNNDSGFITGITKANVDTAIGSGGATTDYYASDKTWKSIPSGGGGDAVLANTQTFTGQNTFSDTAVFSDSSTSGSIEIAGRMVHQGDTDTYVAFGTDIVQTVAGGVEMFRVTNNSSTQQIDVNPLSQNIDFAVNGTFGNARAIFYDSGADRTTINSAFTAANGIARESGGSTTNGIKFWTGTEAQYNALGTGRDQNTLYNITDA